MDVSKDDAEDRIKRKWRTWVTDPKLLLERAMETNELNIFLNLITNYNSITIPKIDLTLIKVK